MNLAKVSRPPAAFFHIGGCRDGMTDEPSWLDLVEELKKIKQSAEPLWADWYAYAGSEDYGIWHLRPGGPQTDEVRATFSLFAARAIEKLGIPPIATPQPSQHFPGGKLYCDVAEETVRPEGNAIDLSNAVPYGLGVVDWDAVDPCTRAWLELLRRESAAFQFSEGRLSIKGKEYTSLSGKIRDLCGASAVYCTRRARDEIGSRLIKRDHRPGNSPAPVTTQSDDILPKAEWEDIEIRFLSEERVQIFIRGKAADTKNFAEMGFEDRRGSGGKPKQAWHLLKALSQNDGMIPAAAICGQQAMQKRAQEVRDLLSSRFHITEDPLPFVEGRGYKTRFKISRSPACDT